MSSPEGTALRLTFAHDGDTVQLTAARRVDMQTSPSHPVEGYQGQAGFWLEVRNASGKTIYRRVIPDPMPAYHEVFSPGGSSTHVPVRDRSGVFEIAVPAPPAGSVVVLFGTLRPTVAPMGAAAIERARPAVPRVGTDPASEIARFPLDGVAP